RSHYKAPEHSGGHGVVPGARRVRPGNCRQHRVGRYHAETEVEPERRLSALFLASDLLHNSAVKLPCAAFYRTHFQRWEFFPSPECLACSRRLGVCLQAVKHRQPASSVIRAWSEWALYQPDYLMRLNNAFLGLLVPDQQQQQQLLESVSAPAGELEKDPSASRSPAAAALRRPRRRFCRASPTTTATRWMSTRQPLALSGGGGFTRSKWAALDASGGSGSGAGLAPTLSTAMRLLVLSLFCLSLAAPRLAQPPPPTAQCVADAYPPPPDTLVPTARVNLDEPRGHPMAPAVVAPRAAGMRALLGQFRQFLFNLTGSDSLMNIVDKEMVPLSQTLPEPFRTGGVSALSNLSLGEVTLFNVFYELFPLCTSILAEDSSGRLFHARNMDFGLFLGWNVTNSSWIIADYLRPLLINVEFYRGGRLVSISVLCFLSSHYAGYIGVLTGLRPHQFSLSVNSRVSAKTQSLAGVVEWLLGIRDQYWLGVATRAVLENATDYGQAKQRLANWKLIAPVYFILGGAKHLEGCVITRDRAAGAADIWERAAAGNHSWRGPGNACMAKKGQDEAASFSGLFNVLSSIPVLNKLTVYTALMRVDDATLVAYRRQCPDPCAP
uniref:ceramidase n=1 Tax=Macrostomum lignano TaxID=282301 RepID=A0A1I8JQR0_9PLAT